MMRRALPALAVVLACHPARPGPAAGVADGLRVVIYADRGAATATPRPGLAYVDDRRWLEVPATGWLDLVDVAADLELDSVVVASASDPGGFEASQCHRVGADHGIGDGAWLVGHAVTLTTAGGVEVAGQVRAVAGLVGVIADDALGPTEVLGFDRGPVDGDLGAAVVPVTVGQVTYGRTGDGTVVYGRLLALRAATATVETAAGHRVEVTLGSVVRVQVADVAGAPSLRCRVRAGRPGRHLVRISYASPGFSWSARYRTAVPAGDAAVTSIAVSTRFTIAAPALATARPTAVELVAGLPGGAAPPVPVWGGEVSIGGGPVVVVGEPVVREARLGWVYRGALPAPGEDPSSDYWHVASHSLVWHELALAPRPTDVPGLIEVVVDAGQARVVSALIPAADPARPTAVRIPLTTSSTLVGFRRKRELIRDASAIADEILYSVSNRGDQPVRVTIEEELRDFRGPTIRHQRPEGAGELRAGRFQRVVEIAAGAIAQGAFVVQYQIAPPVTRAR